MASGISKLVWTTVLGVAVVAGLGGRGSWTTLDAKVKSQEKVISEIRKWREGYAAVLPSVSQWQAAFPHAAQVQDVFSLYALLDPARHGLAVTADSVTIEKIDRISAEGHELKLNAVCLGTQGRTGLIGTAPDLATLVSAVQSLASRPDIRIQSVVFDTQATPGVPMTGEAKPSLRVILEGLCLLIRDKVEEGVPQ